MFNQIIIHKNKLINNIKQVKAENPNSKVCVMVKANAYGVGDKEVVQILEEYVDFWGVACFFEANRIKALTKKNILIVGALEKENIDESFSYTCSCYEDVKYLTALNRKIKIHLKINSGMNRYGFKSLKEFKRVLGLIKKSELCLEGVFTHFATTDSFVNKQTSIFNKYVSICKSFGFNPIVHADNSLVNENSNHGLDMVRVGLSVYSRSEKCFLPAIEIKTKIVNIVKVKPGELVGYNYRCVANKNMIVGIVPIGYADGFDMRFIGLTLNVNGVNCKVLNICMDCFMIDLTQSETKKGDEIYMINKFNPLTVYADYLETSVYEVSTKFSKMRAERIIV